MSFCPEKCWRVFDPIGYCNRLRPSWVENVLTVISCSWAPGEAGNSTGLILRRGKPISNVFGAKAHADVLKHTRVLPRIFFKWLQIQLHKNWPEWKQASLLTLTNLDPPPLLVLSFDFLSEEGDTNPSPVITPPSVRTGTKVSLWSGNAQIVRCYENESPKRSLLVAWLSRRLLLNGSSVLGTNYLKFEPVCPQNGTAVLAITGEHSNQNPRWWTPNRKSSHHFPFFSLFFLNRKSSRNFPFFSFFLLTVNPPIISRHFLFFFHPIYYLRSSVLSLLLYVYEQYLVVTTMFPRHV